MPTMILLHYITNQCPSMLCNNNWILKSILSSLPMAKCCHRILIRTNTQTVGVETHTSHDLLDTNIVGDFTVLD